MAWVVAEEVAGRSVSKVMGFSVGFRDEGHTGSCAAQAGGRFRVVSLAPLARVCSPVRYSRATVAFT